MSTPAGMSRDRRYVNGHALSFRAFELSLEAL
jgi:hypothetical protein